MSPFRLLITPLAVAATVAAMLAATTGSSAAAVPLTVSPVVSTNANTVRATAMPTAQIDGVAWTQLIIGNTVYVGGKFATARPAGSAPGQNTVPRANLLAYNLSTGQLVTGFAPQLNDQVLTLAASPDGSRLYVGGSFTSVNGVSRYRIAAFDTGTGALITSFAPGFNYTVKSIVATDTTVYVGGQFGNANNVTRARFAAFDTSGHLLAWNPSADGTVFAMVMSPDGSKLVVAGAFDSLNGTQALGLGALSPVDGSTVPFAANQKVYAYGQKAAFLSLSTDGTAIYGSAFDFGGTANLEGSFSADPTTGAINWIEDCHGDTYSVFSSGTNVYTVGHAHFCSNIGGFPQVATPGDAHRALAFTPQATGTIQHNSKSGYADLYGNPSPSLEDWFPDMTTANYSGSDQAAWSVTGNSNYVTLAGEFPTVNGVGQEGLVRFAVVGISPDTEGPRLSGASFVPTATSLGTGAMRVAFGANWDRDDMTLNYKVTRDRGSGTPSTVAWQGTAASVQWSLPTVAFADTGLTPGATYRYRLIATDAAGNQAVGNFTNLVAPTSGNPPSNQPPTAVIAQSVTGATVAVDGSGSTDSDGQVSRYAWSFGDGAISAAKTTSHTYTAAGTYTISLTVTDDDGATASTSTRVSVTVPNQPPVARFSASTSGLTLSVNAAASTDPDGTIAGYGWDFGDGQTGTGVAPSHTYTRSGTYTVTLTVYDDAGASGRLAQSVTVSTTPVVLVNDTFGRTVGSGWGSADTGGAWTVSAAAPSAFSVGGGAGSIVLATPGGSPTVLLGTQSLGDTNTQVDVAVDQVPNPGAFVSVVARHTGSSDYRAKLKLVPGGQVVLYLSKISGGTETVLSAVAVSGVTPAAGQPIHVRFQVTGTSAVALAARVWTGATEPTGWQTTATDTSATLGAGAPGIATYLSGSATNAPVTVSVSNLTVSSVPE